VVEIVRMAVSGAAPEMPTGLEEPKLKVGRSRAPAGLEVMAATNATLPVNPLAGVTVIVETLPVVAPGATATAVPLTVKLGFAGAAVTVTCGDVPVALL
jgi:hypothetical protein